MRSDNPVPQTISFADLMWNLPLMDDLYLAMQGQNVMLVDFYLRDLERNLLRELLETESTSYGETVILSALSQMWIFAVYELLRTWRQRIKDLKREAQKPAAPLSAAHSRLAGMFYKKQLAQLREARSYAKALDQAMKRTEPLFRLVEALRMNLAKHEVPKMNRVAALAPGYGRFDRMNESISWQIDLGNNCVQLISRREIADELRNQVIHNAGTSGAVARPVRRADPRNKTRRDVKHRDR